MRRHLLDQNRAMLNLILAATQRCGSTMILEDLRNANVFGLPEEYMPQTTFVHPEIDGGKIVPHVIL